MDDRYFTLSIENPRYLLDTLQALKDQSNGIEGDFKLVQNYKALHFEKSFSIITDFTDIDFNTKFITNLLRQKFTDFVADSKQLHAITDIERILLNLVQDFAFDSNLSLDYDITPTAQNLCKILQLKIANSTYTLLQKLIEYINILCDLKPIKCLALTFVKQFLSTAELNKLHHHCLNKNLHLLLIQPKDPMPPANNERRLIIDPDLCPIPIGYDD